MNVVWFPNGELNLISPLSMCIDTSYGRGLWNDRQQL